MLKKLLSRRATAADLPDDSGDAEVAAKPRESRGLSIMAVAQAAFLLSALLMAALGYVAYLQTAAELDAQRQAMVAAQGERLAAELTGRIQALIDAVDNAAAQPTLANALAAQEGAALADRGETLASAIPGALRLRLLPLGASAIDDAQLPRLGYAGLDLAHQAEKGTRPPLEVHWFGAPDQHIAIARAVAAPSHGPAGVLLAQIDLKRLERWLTSVLPAGGYAELRQNTGGDRLLLMARGETTLQGSAPTASVMLPGTTWELVYWLPGAAPAIALGGGLKFFAPFVAATLLLALLFTLLGWWLGRLVRSDLLKIVDHVVDLQQRKRDHGYTVRLRDARAAVQMLDENVQLPARHESHDETNVPEDPMFLHHGGIAVEEVDEAPTGERKE